MVQFKNERYTIVEFSGNINTSISGFWCNVTDLDDVYLRQQHFVFKGPLHFLTPEAMAITSALVLCENKLTEVLVESSISLIKSLQNN